MSYPGIKESVFKNFNAHPPTNAEFNRLASGTYDRLIGEMVYEERELPPGLVIADVDPGKLDLLERVIDDASDKAKAICRVIAENETGRELTNSEIGRALGMSEDAVRKQLSRLIAEVGSRRLLHKIEVDTSYRMHPDLVRIYEYLAEIEMKLTSLPRPVPTKERKRRSDWGKRRGPKESPGEADETSACNSERSGPPRYADWVHIPSPYTDEGQEWIRNRNEEILERGRRALTQSKAQSGLCLFNQTFRPAK